MFIQTLVKLSGRRRIIRPLQTPRPGRSYAEFLYNDDGFAQSSSFFLSTALAKKFPFREDLNQMVDHLFFIEVGASGSAYLLVPEPLTIWHNEDRPDRVSTSDTVSKWRSTVQTFFDSAAGLLPPHVLIACEARFLSGVLWRSRPGEFAQALAQGVEKRGVIGPAGWNSALPQRHAAQRLRCPPPFVGIAPDGRVLASQLEQGKAPWRTTSLAQVRRLDLWILHHLNSLSGDWLVDHMIDFISSSNLIKGAVPIAIYWYFWFNGTSGRVQNRVVLVKGVIAAIVAVAAARGLAHMLPVELRPFADPTSGFVPPLEATQRNFENWSAFPSDTAAYEFALGTSLFFISPFWGAALLMFTGIASCATRVFIGIHYPSDILVGALMAFAPLGDRKSCPQDGCMRCQSSRVPATTRGSTPLPFW